VRSLPGGMEALCVGEKGQDFILGHLYIILNLEVRRKIHVTPCLQWPRASGGAGQTHAYTYANSQVP
jgi:hypothetical protein